MKRSREAEAWKKYIADFRRDLAVARKKNGADPTAIVGPGPYVVINGERTKLGPHDVLRACWKDKNFTVELTQYTAVPK